MPGTTQQATLGESQPTAAENVASKRDLTSWWKNFKKTTNKKDEKVVEETQASAPGIFGVPLQQSIKYANVAISLVDEEGRPFTYGYVPIVVAKCGVFLKEKATDVEGIFRLAGAERRIRELQNTFNSPERYGKGLDWNGFTVHDAANILRRYFNQLPEPIIPLNFYNRFREPLKHHQAQAVGAMDHQEPTSGHFDAEAAIKTYQTAITELPPLNRQLLLYILDLLAVFASKSDLNRMTAPNLAAIFQPGILSHPEHDMIVKEYRLSQDVLIFLIVNQDNFIVGMEGTAADEKTIKEVQGGAAAAAAAAQKQQPGTPTSAVRNQHMVNRSTSSASAGADSIRKFGGIRRNVSVSSRRSRQSANSPSPVTPPPDSYSPGASGGLSRSNTLPSKKSASPALGSGKLSQRPLEQRVPSSANRSPLAESHVTSVAVPPEQRYQAPTSAQGPPVPTQRMSPHLRPVPTGPRNRSQDRSINDKGSRPKKLQKKRPDVAQLSAQSSNNSLGNHSLGSAANFPPSPAHGQWTSGSRLPQSNHDDRPTMLEEEPQELMLDEQTATNAPQRNDEVASGQESSLNEGQALLKDEKPSVPLEAAHKSPPASTTSDDDEEASSKKRHSRWKNFSISAYKEQRDKDQKGKTTKEHKGLAGNNLTSSTLGSYEGGAEQSTSSVGSLGKAPRKSLADDSNATPSRTDTGLSEPESVEKKPAGPIGWFKGKLQDRKDERERAKSPPASARIDTTSTPPALASTTGTTQPPTEEMPAQHAVPQTTTTTPPPPPLPMQEAGQPLSVSTHPEAGIEDCPVVFTTAPGTPVVDSGEFK